MANFSLNPLRWLKRKPQLQQTAPSTSAPLLKPAAQPRKSGNIFMQLITLHKSLQSMELAFRQGIDSTWLLHKTSDQIGLLKRDAETTGEDELAQGAGQLLAYLDTVSEGRLDLDQEGIKVIRDFVTIFKDAMGDAAPGLRALNNEQLEAWNSRYQSLMARMKPIEEDIELPEFESETLAIAVEENTTVDRVQADSAGETVKEAEEQVLEGVTEDEASVSLESAGELDRERNGEPLGELAEETAIEDLAAAETTIPDKILPYDPSDETHVRDVVISDVEIKSAREFMELGERKPELAEQGEKKMESTPDLTAPENTRAIKDDRSDGASLKTPVQLEEVERLKKKLLELHEKQEMLSSKMSGILGGLKREVKGEQKEGEPLSIEDLELGQIEDIIFVGRRKG